jgi:predicted HTH transcriptional regulator
VGSYKKKLRDFPEKERALWSQLSGIPFENGIALDDVDDDGVLRRIDYPAFFDLMKLSLPSDRDGIIRRLEVEKLIVPNDHSKWSITNLGAILFAKRLSDFEGLARKAVRVIIYQGLNRVETVKEQDGTKGYAVAFEGLISYINDQLPINEVIGPALRSEVRMFPEIAIRELVANAIIHQDFSATGDSPLVEIFSDRIEITNYGQPLINPDRFIDEPPQSRNERLAAFMRRINVCEERGSGIDKVIFHVESYQLPAPIFQVTEHHTRVTLFAHRKLSAMDRKDRIRACYQHACLLYVSSQKMTNATLRRRLAIEERNYAIASRIIADTIEANYIKLSDPESSSKKHASYIPFWA